MAFTVAPVKPSVTIDDFAGIRKERANRREIEDRQALFLVNVEPKRMAGEVSEGMLLDIGYADGLFPVLAVPEKPVPDGARAG